MIPVAMATDTVMGKKTAFTAPYFCGSALVLVGFTLVNLTSKEREQKLYERTKARLCKSRSAGT